jgi:hypothetical protein
MFSKVGAPGFEPGTFGSQIPSHPTLANRDQHLTTGIIRNYLIDVYWEVLAKVRERWKRVEKYWKKFTT